MIEQNRYEPCLILPLMSPDFFTMRSSVLLFSLLAFVQGTILSRIQNFFRRNETNEYAPFPFGALPIEIQMRIADELRDSRDLRHLSQSSHSMNVLVKKNRPFRDRAQDFAYLTKDAYHNQLFKRGNSCGRVESGAILIIPSRSEFWFLTRCIKIGHERSYAVIEARNYINEDVIQLVLFKFRKELPSQFGIWTSLRRSDVLGLMNVYEPIYLTGTQELIGWVMDPMSFEHRMFGLNNRVSTAGLRQGFQSVLKALSAAKDKLGLVVNDGISKLHLGCDAFYRDCRIFPVPFDVMLPDMTIRDPRINTQQDPDAANILKHIGKIIPRPSIFAAEIQLWEDFTEMCRQFLGPDATLDLTVHNLLQHPFFFR